MYTHTHTHTHKMAFYSAIKNEIMLFVGIMDGIGELQVK
jgi:hypothetical protein